MTPDLYPIATRYRQRPGDASPQPAPPVTEAEMDAAAHGSGDDDGPAEDALVAFERARADAAAAVAQDAAERQALIDSDPRAHAAQILGMKPREVAKVRRRRVGTLVHMFDGNVVVLVPEDRPDAEGRTGVLWWRRPATYVGPQATYAKTSCADPKACPHRPFAPTVAELDARAKAEAEARRAAEAAEAAKPPPPGSEPWAQGDSENAVTYRTLLRREADLLARLATVTEGGRGPLEVQLEATRALLRGIGAELSAAHLDANPPAPDPFDVDMRRVIYAWATAIRALYESDCSDRRLAEAHLAWLERYPRQLQHMRPIRGLMEREQTMAGRWLTDHGLDLPDPAEVAP